MNNRINVCLSCDENYAKYAGIVIASILSNAKVDDDIHIYILDGNISTDSKNKILSLKNIKNCEIEFVDINENDFEDYKKISTHNYISISTYYRLKLASLLPNIDRIIYLDCDVAVCDTLDELFNIDMQDNIIAGVLDMGDYTYINHKYINAGVLLMDLDKIRKYNIEAEFLNYAKNNIENIKFGDQDIINNVLKDKILNINEKFNVQSGNYIVCSSYTKNPIIIHYVGGKKPWHYASWSIHKDFYFKALQLTPWKLSGYELFKWTKLNKISSLISWFLHRPFFFLQNKFWNAVKKDLKERK